ncbi:hypothetical protein JQC81_25495 [Microvirga arabica]|nr:hypothetical protein [Microvirga arabica]MBM1174265.1 hypothetical protein [Microvirga arabica]
MREQVSSTCCLTEALKQAVCSNAALVTLDGKPEGANRGLVLIRDPQPPLGSFPVTVADAFEQLSGNGDGMVSRLPWSGKIGPIIVDVIAVAVNMKKVACHGN